MTNSTPPDPYKSLNKEGGKQSANERRKFKRMMKVLDDLDQDVKAIMLIGRLVPKDWHEMEKIAPTVPQKAKITTLVDKDVLKWYRGLGRGYQARINAVLRSYMLCVISKAVEGEFDRDWNGDLI